MDEVNIISQDLVNGAYDKQLSYQRTEEERKLYESMKSPVNAHFIDELIQKTLIIDKYRQVMETFGVNWFLAEKDIDKLTVVTQTQQEELEILKKYAGLDKKEEQERKICELKKRQENQLKFIAGSDKSYQEKVEYLSLKLTERERVNKIRDKRNKINNK